jgi:hypothetical protein
MHGKAFNARRSQHRRNITASDRALTHLTRCGFLTVSAGAESESVFFLIAMSLSIN